MKIFENQCITRRAFLTTDTDKNLLFDSRSIEKYWKLEICPRRATGSRVKGKRGDKSVPFPAPAHQTGRAVLPHPAFRLTSP